MINQKYYNLNPYIKEFKNAKPYPHIILEDFFTESFFKKISIESELSDQAIKNVTFESIVEKNKTIHFYENLNFVNETIKLLSEEKWINQLKLLTDIEDISSDDINHNNLSNYHVMTKSGFLGSHVDTSVHNITKSKHILNIVIYLSNDWHSSYGGNTILYNYNGSKEIKKIDYFPNKALIFLHSPFTFHGVDKIIDNAEGRRKTFYIDYYSKMNNPYKSLNLSFPNYHFNHPTTFILPNKLDYFKKDNFKYLYSLVNYNFNKFLKRFSPNF